MKYQYMVKKQDGQAEEFWVCNNCKKANNQKILLGNWRLVDKSTSSVITCKLCEVRVEGDNKELMPTL